MISKEQRVNLVMPAVFLANYEEVFNLNNKLKFRELITNPISGKIQLYVISKNVTKCYL